MGVKRALVEDAIIVTRTSSSSLDVDVDCEEVVIVDAGREVCAGRFDTSGVEGTSFQVDQIELIGGGDEVFTVSVLSVCRGAFPSR